MKKVLFALLILSSTTVFAAEHETFQGRLTGGSLAGYYMIDDKEADSNTPAALKQVEALIQEGKTECVVASGSWDSVVDNDGLTEHIFYFDGVKPCKS